jgi:hemolysin activation/secretion protein
LLGTAVSLADVQRVARAIEGRYRADGFFLSRALVPVQAPTAACASG